MKRLERLKLYGDGLVSVGTPSMVARYNRTLEELGLEPTELTSFHIDGMGWSPEIAEEKGERYYLSHGMANPLAVILTPAQRSGPVYAPFTSYDWRLLRHYFEQLGPEIADITRDSAIWLEFDRQLSRFNSPRDLLLAPYVTVRSHAGELTQASQEQAALVKRFQEEELAWYDDALRRRILDSAESHGDLRFRRLHLPELRFEEAHSFYTGLFGGVFVLRDLRFTEHLLVLQAPAEDEDGESSFDLEWHLGDPKLIDRLCDESVVDLDVAWYRRHLDVLREKLEYMAAAAVCAADPEVDFAALTPPQRKLRLQASEADVPDTYFELERVIVQLETGALDPQDLSRELCLLLLHPHQRFKPGGVEHALIWQLLCRISSVDVARLYYTDKQHFFETYVTWPESKKRWAAERIAARYRP